MGSLYSFLASFFSKFLSIVPESVRVKLGDDKIMHFFGGVLVALSALVSFFMFSTGFMWIIKAPVIVGVVKELLDLSLNMIEKHKGLSPTHGVEWKDAVATAAGSIPVYILGKVILLLI